MESGGTKDSPSQRRAHPSGEEISFGDEIRRERQVRGVELTEIAEATKVSRRFLEALEANEFDVLPGGLFTRGFIRAYATHIGADPDRLVNAYLLQLSRDEEAAAGGAHDGPRLESLDPGPGGSPGPRRGLWMLLIAILVVGVPVVWFLLPGGEPSGDAAAVDPPPPARTVPPPAPTPEERVLEVVAGAENRIRVSCSGEIRLDRTLAAAERAVVRCAGELRLDASSGGDLRLVLDGEDLGAPGPPGAELRGWGPPARVAASEAGP